MTSRIVAITAIVGLTLTACSGAPPPPAGDRPNAPGNSAGEGDEVPPGFTSAPSYRVSMIYDLIDKAACGPGWSETEHTLREISEGEISFDVDHPLEADVVYAGTGTVEVRETFTLNLCPEWMPPEGAEPCNETVEWLALATVTATILHGAEAAAFKIENPDPDQTYMHFWYEATSVTVTDEADCDRPNPDASSVVASPGRAVPLPEEGATKTDFFEQRSDPATVELGIDRLENWQVTIEAPLLDTTD